MPLSPLLLILHYNFMLAGFAFQVQHTGESLLPPPSSFIPRKFGERELGLELGMRNASTDCPFQGERFEQVLFSGSEMIQPLGSTKACQKAPSDGKLLSGIY